VHRETLIAKLNEIQQNVGQLLANFSRASMNPLLLTYQSRREFRSACQRAGKSGKQIERCVISTFQVAESMGFKGELRQCKGVLRIGD
jgi:hypothetical protein